MNSVATSSRESPRGGCEIGAYLSEQRIQLHLAVSSKKRLLEEMAGLLVQNDANLDRDTIFQILLERERLGSTGIGQGVALPHGRINGIDEPILAVARLKTALEFDAPDDLPVDLVIALLVPAQATDTHLQILAGLAAFLSRSPDRERITNAASPHEFMRIFNQIES